MAIMFPERLPSTVESEAERKLFDEFRRDFSDDFVVFSQVQWLSKRRGAAAQDGEADFVVAHPRHGVLVLEVKGGGIEYEAGAGQWWSIDRLGERHAIKDPFDQARRSMYALRSVLQEAETTRPFSYPLTYAACFPDVAVEVDLGPAAPKEIVLDLPKVRSFKQSIIDCYRHRHRPGQEGPGDQGMKALRLLLGRSWKVETCLGAALDIQETRINELTEQQYALLTFLGSRPRALISGCAGAGKTMLAIEKARRLAASGLRVLFTCFNTHLATWVAGQLQPCGVEVKNFHRLCKEYAESAGLELEKREGESDSDFFDRFPDALLEATRRSEERFDAVIVDEGQDFAEEWWVALLSVLQDPEDGILFIFYDDNQQIYGRESAYPIRERPYVLNQNCRNTRQIHRAVLSFYRSDETPTCAGPEGEPPTLIRLEGGEDERIAVGRRIGQLVSKEKVPPGDIAILTPRSRERSAWKECSDWGWTLTWDLSKASGQVICSSIYAFKGLERPVVFVTEVGGIDPSERAKLLYVAFSRARHYLAVAGIDEALLPAARPE